MEYSMSHLKKHIKAYTKVIKQKIVRSSKQKTINSSLPLSRIAQTVDPTPL